jgi:regulatory protein
VTGAGYRPELVEGAIERLLDLGMLDDAAFARAWVESRDRARPRGERALRRELRLKGVPDEIAAEILAERDEQRPTGMDAPSADEAAATRLLERKAPALARIADPRARRERAYSLLMRAGFDSEIASRMAVSALAGGGTNDTESDR